MKQDKIIEDLESTGKYKVLRKYQRPDFYHRDGGVEKLQGILLDIETTGLSHEIDKIIEIALVPFEFSKDGRIFNVNDSYSCLEDPQISLSQKIISLTGLTDAILAGKSFDTDSLNKIIEPADLLIAHNANFDRKFVEKRFPIFETKSWACSASQIPWENEGIASSKLEYLAYKFGFFFDGHRAEIDCNATLHLLSKTLPKSGDLVLDVLLKNARSKSFRIWAVGSDFGKKDILKNRDYRWSTGEKGGRRSWYIDVQEEEIKSELDFLKKEIYERDIDLPKDVITPFNRFSERIGT